MVRVALSGLAAGPVADSMPASLCWCRNKPECGTCPSPATLAEPV